MSSPYSSVLQSAPATVEIQLGEQIFVLQPKLSAMKAINRMASGYAGALRALANFDADAFATVIAAGTGATGKGVQDIEQAVYAHGVYGLMKPVVHFVRICMAGGRDPDRDDDKEAVRDPAG